jgi:hypothetical protein
VSRVSAPIATRRAVALNQAFGAISFAVGLVASSNQGRVLPDSYLFAAYTFIVWACLASVSLWRGTSFGIGSSMLFQALAIFGYTDLPHSWLLELGGQIQLEIGRSGLDLHIGFGGRFGLWPWLPGSAEPTVWFDLVALLCFLFLLKARRPSESFAQDSTAPRDPLISTKSE